MVLEAELIEARAAGAKAHALWNAAYDKAGDWAFGWPRVDFSTPVMEKMRIWLERDIWFKKMAAVTLDEIKTFNRHTQLLAVGEDLPQRKAEGRDRIRWWIKARRAQMAAKEAVGMDQLDVRCENACERTTSIEKQLWDTPPETLRSVVIRLREAHRDYVDMNGSGEDGGDFYSVAFGKVLSDLERLAGEAPS